MPNERAANDQLAARARDDLNWHIASCRRGFAQGGDDTDHIAGWAFTLMQAMDADRLASLLAVAIVRMARQEDVDAFERDLHDGSTP